MRISTGSPGPNRPSMNVMKVVMSSIKGNQASRRKM